jgi:hypothetical protein
MKEQMKHLFDISARSKWTVLKAAWQKKHTNMFLPGERTVCGLALRYCIRVCPKLCGPLVAQTVQTRSCLPGTTEFDVLKQDPHGQEQLAGETKRSASDVSVDVAPAALTASDKQDSKQVLLSSAAPSDSKVRSSAF